MIHVEYLTAGLNAMFSLAIVFVCICRADKITRPVLARVKLSYIVLVMAAASNGASPWLFELPGWPSVFFSGAVLLMLIADSFQWKNGPPESATGPAPLE
jgi:hypothetical protein